MKQFAHLHVHTEFSLLDGAISQTNFVPSYTNLVVAPAVAISFYGHSFNLDNTIVLQRYGYSKEASTYIIKHINDFIDRSNPTPAFPFMLRKSALLECGNSDVVTETPEIHINVPELFIE